MASLSTPSATPTVPDNTYTHSLPKDQSEHDRLEEQGIAITKMIGGRPVMTDLQSTSTGSGAFTAVDVGCGTGAVSTYLGNELKRTHAPSTGGVLVYGVDLSPVPSIHEKPENVEYVQGDVTELAGADPRFRHGSFDFLFHRQFVLAIPDWTAYARICFSLLKPGGRVEMQDSSLRFFDIDGAEISQDWKWLRVLKNTMPKFKMDMCAPEQTRAFLLEAGFVDVEKKTFMLHLVDEPWDEHPELAESGRYASRTLLPAFRLAFPRMMERVSMTKEDFLGLESVEGWATDYSNCAQGLAKGSHIKYYVITGRKP